MESARPLTLAELEQGLAHIRQSPLAAGVLELIVRRPAVGEREVLTEGALDLRVGLVGDNWRERGSTRTPDGTAHPEMQLTLMNARVAALLAGPRERWPLAGDQLYVDFDLSLANLPPGTRLQIGSAVVAVTTLPHTGCAKFSERFGSDALRFVNAPPHKELRLRGLNAQVIQPGLVKTGDRVAKLGEAA